MGAVYLAHDTKLNRKVALKILPAEIAVNQDRMRRFTQEAKTAAAVHHPNIAQIFELEEQDHSHYIVMEYVEGETLRQLMARRKLETKRAVELAAQTVSGLSAAHKNGVIHRDIKPENLVVTPPGQQIMLVPFTGGDAIKTFNMPSTVLGDGIRWTHDSRSITYLDRRGVNNLWSQPLDGGPPKHLSDFKENGVAGHAWSRDGKWLGLVRGTSTEELVLISNFR